MVGPITEEQCNAVKASMMKEFPSIVAARCKRMVAVTACDVYGRPGTYTTCPIFDEGGFVPTGKY
jgi:hypothetical protein